MTDHQIEQKLKSAFTSDIPDNFDQILEKCEAQDKIISISKKGKWNVKYMRRIISAAAVMVIVFAAGIVGHIFTKDNFNSSGGEFLGNSVTDNAFLEDSVPDENFFGDDVTTDSAVNDSDNASSNNGDTSTDTSNTQSSTPDENDEYEGPNSNSVAGDSTGDNDNKDYIEWSLTNGVLTVKGKGEFNGNLASEIKSQITEIVIKDGITSIGSNAFEQYDNLTTVTLPKSIKNIDFNAFRDCEKLSLVHYNGTKSDRDEIVIKDHNENLLEAEWEYNS